MDKSSSSKLVHLNVEGCCSEGQALHLTFYIGTCFRTLVTVEVT